MPSSIPRYSAASQFISVADRKLNIEFPTWLLFPSHDPEQPFSIGPFNVLAAENGQIANGCYPVVMISHGGGGSHLVYRDLAIYLAKNGYIVAMPEHYRNNRNDNSLGYQAINFSYRSRHISLLIDTLLCDKNVSAHIDASRIYLIGHSLGGTTALAVAGGVPWSSEQQPIEVTHDARVRALVLFAAAAAWFQHPQSLEQVKIPILLYDSEFDDITPAWQADLICHGVPGSTPIQRRRVDNGNHFSFLSPFPDKMKSSHFPPSLDRPGFNRRAFHDTLKHEVLRFLNAQGG